MPYFTFLSLSLLFFSSFCLIAQDNSKVLPSLHELDLSMDLSCSSFQMLPSLHELNLPRPTFESFNKTTQELWQVPGAPLYSYSLRSENNFAFTIPDGNTDIFEGKLAAANTVIIPYGNTLLTYEDLSGSSYSQTKKKINRGKERHKKNINLQDRVEQINEIVKYIHTYKPTFYMLKKHFEYERNALTELVFEAYRQGLLNENTLKKLGIRIYKGNMWSNSNLSPPLMMKKKEEIEWNNHLETINIKHFLETVPRQEIKSLNNLYETYMTPNYQSRISRKKPFNSTQFIQLLRGFVETEEGRPFAQYLDSCKNKEVWNNRPFYSDEN